MIFKTLILYVVIINIVTFFLFGIDKRRAIKNRWRISEAMLLTFSLIGGCVGGIIGMSVFHHKTNKMKFKIIIPLILMLHICLGLIIKVNI